MTTPVGEWTESAACAGTPIDLWYPSDKAGPTGVPEEAAAICADCPVRADCLAHALIHEPHGVWAGTSERARARMRRASGLGRYRDPHDLERSARARHLAQIGTPPPVHFGGARRDPALGAPLRRRQRPPLVGAR